MEVVRMFLVFAHLVAVIAAAVAVAFGDFALLGRRRIDGAMLHKASIGVCWALLGLWLSGLAIIAVDTALVWSIMASKPKLLAKLTVVMLLTANGLYLHRVVLPSLIHSQRADRPLRHVAARAARAGALSAACWSFAVFLGVARPLAPMLGYAGFMALFMGVLGAALVFARQAIHPELTRRLRAAREERASAARAIAAHAPSSEGAPAFAARGAAAA